MPPPPAMAAALCARPLSIVRLQAQLAHDFEHNAKAKVQNARIEAVFQQIDAYREQAQRLLSEQIANLTTGRPVNVAALGEAYEKLEDIAEKVGEGIALEQEDVAREYQRGHENGVRQRDLRDARRHERHGEGV